MARTNASMLIDSEDLGQFSDQTFRNHWTTSFDDLASICLMNSCIVTTKSTTNASISVEFDGVSVSLFGLSPLGRAWGMLATMDGRPAKHQIPPTPFWGRFYTSVAVAKEWHTVELTGIPEGVYIDYAVAHPPFKYPVREETLIVDDNDPIIRYLGGGWEESDKPFYVLNDAPTEAYGGRTHTSRTVGDVLQFPFTGSTLSVYGYVLLNVTGSISVTFQIDNSAPITKKIPPDPNSQGTTDNVLPNYLFFDESALSSGDHILTVNVTDVQGDQRFILDFILYEATFDSLDNMPVIQLPPLPGFPAPSSASQTAANPSGSSTAETSSVSSNANIGAIVGGVLGGIASLTILSLIFCLVQRRRRRMIEAVRPAPFRAPPPPGPSMLEKDQPSYTAPLVGTSLNEPVSASPATRRDERRDSTVPSSGGESSLPRDPQTPSDGPYDPQRVLELERRIHQLEEERHPPPRYSITAPKQVDKDDQHILVLQN